MNFEDPILVGRTAKFLSLVGQKRPLLLATRRSCLKNFGLVAGTAQDANLLAKSALFDDLSDIQSELTAPELLQIKRCVFDKSSEKFQRRRRVPIALIGNKFARVVIAFLDRARGTNDLKVIETKLATVVMSKPRHPTDPTTIAIEIPHFIGAPVKGGAILLGEKGSVELDFLRLFGEVLFDILDASIAEAEEISILTTDLMEAFRVALEADA
jgi:hypothetical protein